MTQLPRRILVVGAGHAGGRLAHHLHAMGHEGEVILAGAEPHAPYERPPLSKELLTGAMAPTDLALKPAAQWHDDGVALRLDDPVEEIDLNAQLALTRSGARLGFDVLVMATGSRNTPLPAPHATEVPNLRGLDDSLALRAKLVPGARLAIVGGGVIGLEVAAAACALGVEVRVFEAGPRVMARILSPAASDWLALVHRAAGVRLDTGTTLTAIEADGGAWRLTTPAGRIGADAVLVAIGARPDTALLPQAPRGPAGGFLCDAGCRIAGLEGIAFAIGDVAEAWNPLYGRPVRLETWRNAETQAKLVAATLCGAPAPLPELPWMWTDQHGHNLQVLGLWDPRFRTVSRGTPGERGAVEFWLDDGVMRGAVLFDAGRERRHIEALIRARARPAPDALADPGARLKDMALAA